MVQEELKSLLDLYERAALGEPVDDAQLFALSVSFLEKLKLALLAAKLPRREGWEMMSLLKQRSAIYQEYQKRHPRKKRRSAAEVDERRELKKRFAIVVEELGALFRSGAPKAPQSAKEPVPATKRPRRLHREKWIRS